MTERLTRFFPLWAMLLSAIAYTWPGPWTAASPAIVPLLGLVMFGMGITLAPAHFAAVMRQPSRVLLGTVLQFGIMPLAAWLIGLGLGLPAELLAGLVLVGACPGGTASNVICYLGRGDVALSITLTTVSTLLAILLTPALTWLYVGRSVPVPAGSMLWTILTIVLLPVAAGVLASRLAGARLRPLQHVFPAVSIAAIVVIIAIIVALNRDNIAGIGATVTAAVTLHNLTGLAAGYGFARMAGHDPRTARTLAIEVGMQNSGLAVALAVKYFSAAAALPAAVFSIWHNLSGSLLAAFWNRRRNNAPPRIPALPRAARRCDAGS